MANNIISISDFAAASQAAAGSTIPYQTGSTAVAVEEALVNNGFKVINGGVSQTTSTIVNGSNVVANQAMATSVAEGELTVSQIEATTTAGGTSIAKGALSMTVSPLQVVGGVLLGCGLGWESYKSHPEFWANISNKVFRDTNPFGILPELDLNSVGGQVIDRLVGDAGQERIANYIPAPLFEDILKAAAEEGAFNGAGEFIPQYSETGSYVLNAGGATPEIINSVVASSNANIYEKIQTDLNALSNYYNKPINAISMYQTPLASDPSITETLVNCYSLTDTPVNITVDSNSVTAENMVRFATGWILFRVRNSTRELVLDTIHYEGSWWINQIGGYYQNNKIYSTVGAEFKEPNPAVIYNPANVNLLDYRRWRETFTDWLQGTWELPRFNPFTGLNEMIQMIPIQLADIFGNQALQPMINPAAQIEAWLGQLPINNLNPDLLPDFFTDMLEKVNDVFDNFDYPELPTGNTPVIVPPLNNNISNKLFTVYNPSNANLDALGGYLWNDSIIRQLVELFKNNPMDAIISLHQVYCTPSTGTAKNIILGTLNSGVSAPVVTDQYVTINCGTIRVPELYNDARDYIYTQTEIFLPFIGIRSIDCHDVLNCSLTVVYTIDVYTGCTLAEIRVKKGDVVQNLYTFEGNCAVEIPLTSSDRSRIVGTLATAAAGLITKNPAMIASAAGSTLSGSMQSNISKSSSFSGNAGAMGCKIPYLIVTRQKSADAANYNKFIGNPTNKTVYLKDYQGFVRIKDIHLDNLKCTKEEKDMLNALLKEGIII